MTYLDVPPAQVERVVCSITAAIKYQVPANIMLAVAEKEGGRSGLENNKLNSNGTYDVGRMQFNTAYLKDLEKYGITAADVAQPGCYSYDLAAWRIRGHIKNDKGDIWTKAANYHSKTPRFNKVYRADLIKKSAKWQTWIEARFNTFDVTKPTGTSLQEQLTVVGDTPEERTKKNIAQVTDLSQGTTATLSTADQLVGFSASVKQIPIKSVAKTDYLQRAHKLPVHYNKAAADALADTYGNIKLR